jgi:hypothetical protein
MAAETVQPVTGRLRTMVFDAIRESGDEGLTDDQIEVLLDLRHQTASARRRELVQQKWIRDSGRTRKTRSGSPATVWVVRTTYAEETLRKSFMDKGWEP